jgi:hypothetical protein
MVWHLPDTMHATCLHGVSMFNSTCPGDKHMYVCLTASTGEAGCTHLQFLIYCTEVTALLYTGNVWDSTQTAT